MVDIHLDFEVKSRIALGETCVSVYAPHKSTSVMCCGYAIGGNDPLIWVPGDPFPFPTGQKIRFHAWNAEFEWEIWNETCVRLYGWPPVPIRFFYCTQAQACYYGYPRKLDQTARRFGVEKDRAGYDVMMRLTNPKKGKLVGNLYVGGDFLEPTAEEVEQLHNYCMQDVNVERVIQTSLPPMPEQARQYYLANQKINHTGIPVDVEFCMGAHTLFQDEIAKATKRLSEMTAHLPKKEQVTKPTQCKRMLKYLADQGIHLVNEKGKPSMNKDLVAANLDKHEIIRIRHLCKSAAPHKYASVLNHVSPDGICRNNYLFYGAFTGRATGTGVQFHNLKKNRKKADHRIIDAIHNCDWDILDLLYGGEVTQALADYVRSVIIPAPGKKLIVADFSQIEARLTFWFAREDADFSNIYEAMAADIYKVPVETIGKDSDERQLGKATILGAGFGMGPTRGVVNAAKYGVVIDEEFSKVAIDLFRAKYPRIPEMWRNLMRAFEMAYFQQDEIFYDDRISFGYEPDCVWTKLPSGRTLYYRGIERVKVEGKPTFFYTGPRGRKKITPPIIIENIVQSAAADIFYPAIIDLQSAGYDVILQTHDEVGVSCDLSTTVAEVEAIMTKPREWTEGLVIAAEVKEKSRYYGS